MAKYNGLPYWAAITNWLGVPSMLQLSHATVPANIQTCQSVPTFKRYLKDVSVQFCLVHPYCHQRFCIFRSHTLYKFIIIIVIIMIIISTNQQLQLLQEMQSGRMMPWHCRNSFLFSWNPTKTKKKIPKYLKSVGTNNYYYTSSISDFLISMCHV